MSYHARIVVAALEQDFQFEDERVRAQLSTSRDAHRKSKASRRHAGRQARLSRRANRR